MTSALGPDLPAAVATGPPVIDAERRRKIVGVVTDRDLCMTVVAEGRDPRAVSVEQCMTTTVVT